MTKELDGSKSLVGIVMINDELCQKFVHSDGNIEYRSINEVEVKSITERFADTQMAPNNWDPETDAVFEKSKDLPKDTHIYRSCQFEAMMIKLFDGNTITKEIDTKGNEVFKQILTDMCKILGDEWIQKIKNIK